MLAVQMTLEESLVKAVDRAVARLHTTRSAFTREALRKALEQLKTTEQERRHQEGYRRHPVRSGEFDVWESEQKWGES